MSSGTCDFCRGSFEDMGLRRSGNHDIGNNNGDRASFGRFAWRFGDPVQERGQVMTEAVVVAIITGGITLIGTVISNVLNHSKTMYRIDQLEKKQDKHNSMIERMYIVEGKVAAIEGDVSELKGKVL